MKVYILTKPVEEIKNPHEIAILSEPIIGTRKLLSPNPKCGAWLEGKKAIFSALKEIDIDEALKNYLAQFCIMKPEVTQEFSEYLEKL